MYTEERKGNLLKEFLLKLILIIIFVLLLIWLVPWPNMNGYIDALNPLKDQIFNANIQEMKNAAITYYTTERLPQEVGDTKKMTLQEMLDMKLLIPFVDKDGNSCDVVSSYVSLEKKETEYLMKVNLKCGDEENYILVHLGCYSYCSTDICEKDETQETVVKPVVKPTATTTASPKPTVTPTVIPTPTPTATPTIVPTPVPEKHYCEIVDGKYYDKNGNVVSKEEYDKSCSTPQPTPTTTPTPTPTPTPTITPTPDPVKEYQYKKTTPASCTTWSGWTTKILEEGKTLTTVNTIYKVVEDLGIKRVQVGLQTAIYEKVTFTYPQQVQVGTHDYKVCTGYNYVVTGTTITQVSGDWYDSGQEYRGYNPPSDPTSTSKWVPVGVDYDVCGETCANHPYTIWHLYKRNGTSYSSEASVTATCTSVETRSIPLYVTRTITSTKTVLKQAAQPIYDDVHFYREKTCTNVSLESTVYKWSTYDDKELLNNGYTYTGKTRTK